VATCQFVKAVKPPTLPEVWQSPQEVGLIQIFDFSFPYLSFWALLPHFEFLESEVILASRSVKLWLTPVSAGVEQD
jgi:hypothetical protein